MQKPYLCSVYDEEFIGDNATKEDLFRFWRAFNVLIHDRDQLESRGLLREDPEEIPQAIENWLWDDGNWAHRLDEILGEESE